MPTFIDESGDTGWKPGSSPYFRMAAVWLPTHEMVAACRESIRAVRKDLGLPQDYEFKFALTSKHPERRQAFFKAVLEHEFRFVACAYDKRRCPPGSVGSSEFHWGCAVILAAYLRQTYRQAEEQKGQVRGKPSLLDELVIVDDNEDRNFLAEIKRTFRGMASAWRPGAKLAGKVKFRGSRPDEMLQLVDMVVGAAGAFIDGDSTWYDLIATRSLGVVCEP